METLLDQVENKTNQSHGKQTWLYCLSQALERSAYYGLRALVVLFMTSEQMNMSASEAYDLFNWFATCIVLSSIVGAMIGDLVIGNKKSIIIGGVLQAIGALFFCLSSTTGLYTGLALIVLGSGLFKPNIIANFGKSYLHKTRLLDSGFTLLYISINVGSFFGIVGLGYLGDYYGWNLGFVIGGVLMLLSIVPVFFTKTIEVNQATNQEVSVNHKIKNVLVVLLMVGIFWVVYELMGKHFFDLYQRFGEMSTLGWSKYLWTTLSPIITMTLSIIIAIIWTFYYSSQLSKLTLGFVFGAISFAVVWFIPGTPTEELAVVFLVAIFFLSMAEVYIAPVVHSVLTEFTNPRYLAIIVSLAFIPARLFTYSLDFFKDGLQEDLGLSTTIGVVTMVLGSLVLAYIVWSKRKTADDNR